MRMVNVLICIQPLPESSVDRCSVRSTDESGTHVQSPVTEWHLSADALTTGMLVDLLLCLDQLGFKDKSTKATNIPYH